MPISLYVYVYLFNTVYVSLASRYDVLKQIAADH